MIRRIPVENGGQPLGWECAAAGMTEEWRRGQKTAPPFLIEESAGEITAHEALPAQEPLGAERESK